MRKVKDQNGNVLHGVVKQGIGGLVVTDEQQYQKYVREKQFAQKMNDLENEVSELKDMVKSLLQKLN